MANIRTSCLLLLCNLIFFCCHKQDTPNPATTPATTASTEQLLSNKWWCPGIVTDGTGKAVAGLTPSQVYFKSDGTYQQRVDAKDANPMAGKWSLSADKKTILVTDVKSTSGTPQLLDSDDYTITRLDAGALNFGFLGLNFNYTPCS